LLNSKFDSVACWEDGGLINYLVVTDYSGLGPDADWGPNAQGVSAPMLFEIRVNTYPPLQLYHYLKKNTPALPKTLIADKPCLEIRARPRQISRLGPWLAAWYECHHRKDPSPPKPPIKLVYEGAEQPEYSFCDFANLGSDWLGVACLWAPQALEFFLSWMDNLGEVE
jgi:hypothetical protein